MTPYLKIHIKVQKTPQNPAHPPILQSAVANNLLYFSIDCLPCFFTSSVSIFKDYFSRIHVIFEAHFWVKKVCFLCVLLFLQNVDFKRNTEEALLTVPEHI